MSSEPCPRCERDYTTAQAMKSYIDAATLAGDAAIERDKALAALARVRNLIDPESEVARPMYAVFTRSEIRAALDTP